jgi:hypothetical protein
MAEKWLEQQGQTVSAYIDISAETDAANQKLLASRVKVGASGEGSE